MKHQAGFTLIELMVVVVITAILASIALPSYQEYVRRQRLAQAQQEMLTIAGELERFKSKNFSYKGFDTYMTATYGTAYDATTGTLSVPLTEPTKRYAITLVDSTSKQPLSDTNSHGFGWAMTATRITTDPRNYDLLMNSQGMRCRTTDTGVVDTYNDCGTNSETWR